VIALRCLAGSCTTGDYVVMAGQVGIADHMTIGDRAILAAQTGVTKHVPSESRMWGTPAIPMSEHLRRFVYVSKLPQLLKDVQRLQKSLGRGDE